MALNSPITSVRVGIKDYARICIDLIVRLCNLLFLFCPKHAGSGLSKISLESSHRLSPNILTYSFTFFKLLFKGSPTKKLAVQSLSSPQRVASLSFLLTFSHMRHYFSHILQFTLLFCPLPQNINSLKQ